MSCLYCQGDGPFSTTEHIVPESLGNDCDVLIGVVCDGCQRYLGSAVEKPALESTPIGFWRTVLGTRTKAKALPRFSSSPPHSGSFASGHTLTDRFHLVAEEDASTRLEMEKDAFPLSDHSDSHLQVVLSPWHIFTMGRLLGKIGLEYLALTNPAVAMSPTLDPVRNYIRRGSVGWVWPIYMGSSSDLKNLREVVSESEGAYEIETECYRFALGHHINGDYILAFGIGTDLYVINLSSSSLENDLEHLVEGMVLKCVHYPKDALKTT